jgi:hypothetical protein
MIFQVNDIITTKKNHVCGSNQWLVLRTGAEVKIKCIGCGREIMVFKAELDKKIKSVNVSK